MDIKDILSALNINGADPDAVQGAVQALNALKDTKGAWPPPPPPPPTDPPLPMPPKKKDIDGFKKRQKRGEKGGSGGTSDLTPAEMRSITYNRTLEAAKARLEQAEKLNIDPEKIEELRQAIAAMERLTESADSRSIQDLSDEEFDGMINTTLKAILALGITDDELKIYSEEEHKANVQKLADVLADEDVLADLEAEDEAERDKDLERQQNIARLKRKTEYSNSVGKFEGFEAFVNSLYKAIMLQVQMAETEEDTWTAIDKRYYNSGVLKKGTKNYEAPSEKVPIIDFYFDTSGSWGQSDLAMGRKAQNALSILESKGKIKLNVFYFSNGVSAEYSAVAGGGTYAWGAILDNIQKTKATNVVVMTDSDMNNQSGARGQLELSGCVWYLWKNGQTASRIVKDLTGKRGTMQFAFSSRDAANAYAEEQDQ